MEKKTAKAGKSVIKQGKEIKKSVVKKNIKEKKPTDKLADKTALTKFLQGVFGDAQKKTLKRLWKKSREINALEEKYEKMDDEELKAQSEVFRERINKALKVSQTESAGKKSQKGKKNKKVKDDTKILNEILPEVFAGELRQGSIIILV